MPPKRGGASKTVAPADDAADLNTVTESEDDRSLVIQVSGQLKPLSVTSDTPRTTSGAFTAALIQPTFSLRFPSIDPGTAAQAGVPESGVSKTELQSPTEGAFNTVLYSRRLQLNPSLVAQLFGGSFRFVVTSLNETTPVVPVALKGQGSKGAPPPPGKSAGAPKAATAKEGGGTGRSDGHEAEVVERLSFPFVLAGLLVDAPQEKGPCKIQYVFENSTAVHGFERLVLTLASNAPLLGPSNIIRYPAAIITIGELHHLPPVSPIDPSTHRQTTTGPLSDADAAKLSSVFDGVQVKCRWRAGTSIEFVTPRLPHSRNLVFQRQYVLFLHLLPRLKTLQSLFFDPLEFEVRDRDPRPGESPAERREPDTAPVVRSPYGIAAISLRAALDGETRFHEALQVLPLRVEGPATTPVPNYFSFGTMLRVSVVFTTPLPFVTFVDFPRPMSSQSDAIGGGTAPSTVAGESTGAAIDDVVMVPDSPGLGVEPCATFLSRVIIVAPYKSNATSALIRAVMAAVMEQPRPTPQCDVIEVVRKPPPPIVDANAPSVKSSGKLSKTIAEIAPEESRSPPPVAYHHHPFGGKRQQVLATVPPNVSGFELMDGTARVIVIEGQLPHVARIAAVASAVVGPDPSVRIIFNFELPFLRRAYHTWPPLVAPLAGVKPTATESNDAPAEGVIPSPASTKGSRGGTRQPGSGRVGTSSQSKRVPPIASTPASETPLPPPAVTPTTISDVGELDAGGVGGRLRRIRLKQTLDDAFNAKPNYLHRAMKPAALSCLRKIMGLMKAPSIVHCLEHDLFPSSLELIALERVAGDCLDTYDVCAADTFYNFGDVSVDDALAAAVSEDPRDLGNSSGSSGTKIDLTDARSMGKVVSFVAFPTRHEIVKGLPSLKRATQRYPNMAYMTEFGTATHHVPCAFSGAVPTQQLRFALTGQVVSDGAGGGVLFVMACVPLASKMTDSSNPVYDQMKREQKQLLPSSMYFTIKRQEAERFKATHTIGDPHRLPYRDDSSDDEPGFVDDAPPCPANDLVHGDSKNSVAALSSTPRAVTNFVGLERRRLHALSAESTVKRNAEQKRIESQYADAWATYRSIVEREAATQRRIDSLRPKDDRPEFTTFRHQSALEDAKPKLAPSPARVDDLKEPWQPPSSGRHLSPQENEQRSPRRPPMTFDGGLNCTSQTFTSVFAEVAADKARREEEAKRQAKDAWQSRVVVDDVHFRVKLKQPADHPHIVDKYRQTMLDDEPKKYSLRKDRLKAAPVSIEKPVKAIPQARVEPSETKHPEQRAFYYAKDVIPKLPRIRGAVDPNERRGPLWGAYEPPTFRAVE